MFEFERRHSICLKAIKSGILKVGNIAKYTKLTEKTVRTVLGELESAEHITFDGFEAKLKVENSGNNVTVKFAHSQNVTHLRKTLAFFGYKFISNTERVFVLEPPDSYDYVQVQADLQAICSEFSQRFTIDLDLYKKETSTKPIELNKIDAKSIVFNLAFLFHVNEYVVVKMLTKKHIPHDNINHPGDTLVSFVTMDEDENFHEWTINTSKKKSPNFKLYTGVIK